MIAVETFPLDVHVDDHAALYDAAEAAACAAAAIAEAERETEGLDWSDELALPPIAVVDEEGRVFTAARLEREAGTLNFRIVLVAERAA